MKKIILIASSIVLLLAIALSMYLLNGCQKNVEEIKLINTVPLNPDFVISDIKIVNKEDMLNADTILFEVTYLNAETTNSRYQTSICFFVNEDFVSDIITEPIIAKNQYTCIFKIASSPGSYLVKAQINVTPENNMIISDEAELANNKCEVEFSISPVEPQLLYTEEVSTEKVYSFIKDKSLISLTVNDNYSLGVNTKSIKSHFNNDLDIYVSPVVHSGGVIDSTTYILTTSIKADQSYVYFPILVEFDFEKRMTYLHIETIIIQIDEFGKATAIAGLKSISACSESWVDCILNANVGWGTLACLASLGATFAGAGTPVTWAGIAGAVATCGGTATGITYCLYKALTNDKPTLTIWHENNGPRCERCEGDEKVIYTYFGVKATPHDDRGIKSALTEIKGACTSWIGELWVTDCDNETTRNFVSCSHETELSRSISADCCTGGKFWCDQCNNCIAGDKSEHDCVVHQSGTWVNGKCHQGGSGN
jgi:hypothetical protein